MTSAELPKTRNVKCGVKTSQRIKRIYHLLFRILQYNARDVESLEVELNLLEST